MSENSKIEWTDHTFNGWWGCQKVHAGCANCYAEATDARWAGVGNGHWGKDATRRMILGEWSKPAKWNRAAEAAGVPARVFASSMCDIFEDYRGPVVDQQGKRLDWTIDALRRRIFAMIEETPRLEWLMLTKRPENVREMVPIRWLDSWPSNVMTGTSPCNQTTAGASIPELLKVPGRHFLSCEPLLGPLILDRRNMTGDEEYWDWLRGERGSTVQHQASAPTKTGGIDWVIVGGESGSGARPMNIEWVRSIVRQCKSAGVPVFIKQLGASFKIRNDSCDEWPRDGDGLIGVDWPADSYQGDWVTVRTEDRKGGDMAEWPEDLRVREMPVKDQQ